MARVSKERSPLLDVDTPSTAAKPVDGWDRTTDENRKLAQDWKTQIELCERRTDVFEKRGERIIKRYRDERTASNTSGAELDVPRRMNILWSNVQTMKPSIYSREPLPVAERRFLDRDPIGRVAAQILERALRYELTESGFHDAVDQAVQDYLLIGRGTIWLRYKPLVGPATSLTDRGSDEIDPTGDNFSAPEKPTYDPEGHEANLSEASQQEIKEKLLGATVEVDYVHWKDFMHSKCRFWKENEWVARRVYMSRQDCIDRWPAIGKEIPLEMTPELSPGSIGSQRTSRAIPEDAKKAIVYELWFKPKRMVYFIAKGYEFLLEEPKEDPIGLEGFWPCPRPLFATMTNDTLEPVPDYIEYQDQALEIDQLTNRIDCLIKALKVAGVYNASEKQLARLLDEGHENQLIPVNNWAAFAEKGGLANAISFMPIKEIAEVLERLFEARDKIKNDLYEITGIADIMRGQADPRETARAIDTKGKWGSLRLQQRQSEVARFCRDTIKMMGEVISDHFPDKTLIDSSGIMFDEGIGPEPPQPPVLTPPTAPPPGMAAPPANMAGQAGPPGPPAPTNGLAPPAGLGGPGVGAPSPQPAINPQVAAMQYQQALMMHHQMKAAIVQKAIGLLRQDKLRGFRIDIETDSTINDSAKQEKAERVEFMTAMSGFIEKSMQAVQLYPEMMPLLGKAILFTVRGFRVGRDLESSLEEFIDKTEVDLKKMQGQPKPPSPEQIKAQADIQMSQASLQEAQMKLQADQARSNAEIQAQQIEAASEASNLRMKQQMQQVELQIKQFEAESKRQEVQYKAAYDAAQHKAKMQQLDLEMRMKAHEMALELGARKRDQALDEQSQLRQHELDAHGHELDATVHQHQAKMKAHEQRVKAKEKNPRVKVGNPPKLDLPEPPAATHHNGEEAPIPGARKAKDGKWYLKHPSKEQYYRVDASQT